jgi:hypothetical protein
MTTSEIVGAVAGATAALPFAIWGFVLGGTFIAAATGGLLAIPGALLGAGFVLLAGALLGVIASRLAVTSHDPLGPDTPKHIVPRK